MKGLPWYPHNIDSYDRKTAHLTMLQHGAYRLMMDHYYRTATPLPAKLLQVHRICRAVAEDEQAAVSAVLAEFFELRDDGWHNIRSDEELEKTSTIRGKRSNAAKNSHKPGVRVATNAGAKASATDGESAPANAPANAHRLKTIEEDSSLRSESKRRSQKLELVDLPDWLPLEPWEAFIDMRTRSHSKPTAHAMKLLVAKLERLRASGHDPTAVLDQSTMSNWKGLFEIKPESINGKYANGHDRKPTTTDNHLAGIASLLSERRSGRTP